MKLIDKDALVAEIDKLQLCTMDEHMNYYSAEAQGEYNALSKLESFIDTLEVKEIGIDLGDPKGDKSAKHIIDTKSLEVKEVDLEKEIDLDAVIDAYMDKNFGEPWDGARPVGSFELAIMAEHFFELGLKAQKG